MKKQPKSKHEERRWVWCSSCQQHVESGRRDHRCAPPSTTTQVSEEKTNVNQTSINQIAMHQASMGIEDVIERGLRRVLPVDLTVPEFTEIATRRAVIEQERDDMQLDLDKEVKRRKGLIGERDDEIKRMGRELRTRKQDRSVPCTKVFRRDLAGDCWVITLRDDTLEEVAREPASAQLINKHLQTSIPGTEMPRVTNGKRSVLDEAAAAQAGPSVAISVADHAVETAAGIDDDMPDPDEDDDLDPEDLEEEDEDNLVRDDDDEVSAAHHEPDPDLDEFVKAGSTSDESDASSTGAPVVEGAVFDVDDIVSWKSQAGGITKSKTGKVDAVIPIGRTPSSIDARYKAFGSSRKHVSYVVDVDGALYWPVVSQLKLKGKRGKVAKS